MASVFKESDPNPDFIGSTFIQHVKKHFLGSHHFPTTNLNSFITVLHNWFTNYIRDAMMLIKPTRYRHWYQVPIPVLTTTRTKNATN